MSPSIYITCQPSPENILRKTHWKGMDGPLLSETQGPITTEAEEASAVGSSSLKLGATLRPKTTRKQSKNSTWIENVSFEGSDRSQFRIQDGGAGAFDERPSEDSFLLPTTSADDSMVAAERTSIILCEATGQSTIDIADMLNSQDSGILSAGDDSTFTLTGEQTHAKLIINKAVEMKSNPEVHSAMSASCDGPVEEANAANFKLPNVNKTLNANNAIRANSFDLEMTNLGLTQDVNGETGLAPILTDAEMVQIDHDGKEYEVDAKSSNTDVGTTNIGQVLIDTSQLAVAVESLNGAAIDTSGVATLNPNVLQLNISNISPVSLSALGNGQNQPLIYLLTSQEKTTGAVQRFRVSMDPNTSSSTVSDLQLEMVDAVDTNNTTLEANKLLTRITEGKDEHHNHETIEASTLLDVEAQTAPMLSVLDVIQLSDGNQAFVLDGNTTTTTSAPVEIIKQKKEPKKKKKKIKEDEQEQKCEECGEMVANKAKLKVHLLSHKTDRPYKCEVEDCGWSFQTLYKLKRHKMGHGGNKPFVCRVENCGKPFTTIYNLKIHMNTHFRQNLEVCDVEGCEEVFNSKAKLQIHQRKHFLDQQLQCTHPGCDKTFTTTSALGSHQRIHERDQHSFPCLVEGCSKVYEKSCRLKLHMMSHTGERPFKCTFEGCQWAFTCIQKLKRHLVRHTGERKYMCNQDGCNKMFTRLEHLKGHLVSHSGEKPYKCTVEGCNASFSARSSHYMHVKRHKMGKPIKEKYTFCCPWDNCEKMFSSRMGVKNHVIKTHGTPLSFDNEMVFVKLNKDDGKEEEQVESSLASTRVQQMTSQSSVDLSHVASLPQGTVDITELITNAGEIDKQLLLPSLPVSVLTQAADSSIITNYTSTLGNNLCVTEVVDTLTEDVSTSRVRSKIVQENQSGSARTDFIALPKEIRKEIEEMDSRSDLVTSDTVKVSSNSTLSFSSSIFPLSSVSTTGLTLRDPSTGTPYVQTQLLQDDPPGEGDVTFHLPTTTVSPHTSSLANQLSVSILPTSINQSQDAAKTFLNTGSRVTDFTQSTINLQDLE